MFKKKTIVYVQGRDFKNWSIDDDNLNTYKFLKKICNAKVVRDTKKSRIFSKIERLFNLLRADIIHSVYYNSLLKIPHWILKRKVIVAVVTNDPHDNLDKINSLRDIVDYWISPSKKTLYFITSLGLKTFYLPFYTDEAIFKKTDLKLIKDNIFMTNFYKESRNKFVIGSFQKDSESSDGLSPKMQKGPDILVDIISNSKYKEKIILLLAGPYRNYVIKKCRENEIKFFYFGDYDKLESFKTNNIDKKTVNLLYNLVDLYLVSSRSEGGPKAVLESLYVGRPIIASNVGYVNDFLTNEFIFKDKFEAIKKLDIIIEKSSEFKHKSEVLEKTLRLRDNALKANGSKNYMKKLTEMYYIIQKDCKVTGLINEK
jgi:glycosyltransferase involved in cell wall biosynthesis